MNSLKGTKTAENLSKTFAGESQARNKYTYYDSASNKQDFLQIERIFSETADQEKEHTNDFSNFLKNNFNNESIETTSRCSILLMDDTADNLKAATMGANKEWIKLYPRFAKVARKENLLKVPNAFEMASKVEKELEARYLALLESIIHGQAFKKPKPVLWKCTNCGFIFKGIAAPEECPSCLYSKDYFEVFCKNY